MPALDDSLRIILGEIKPLGVERVDLQSSLGRVLARDVSAPWDIPNFSHSTKDGFALRSSDCPFTGSTLRVVGFIPAGGRISSSVTEGCAVRIMTGAPVPPNCDAVVPIEETESAPGRVKIMAPVRRGQHIRSQGEDAASGDLVLTAGTVIQSQEIGVLASFGQAMVSVYQKARVAVLSTGDELVELGETPVAGRIVNSNAQYLVAALREIGAEPVILGIARDNRQSLRHQISAGLKADALVTTAGVSAGDRDLVRNVLAELKVRQLLWKVDVKQGGPKAFGMKEGTPVFSLPGNPVSTMVTFEEFVRPALLKMMGHRRVIRPYFKAKLRDEMHKKPGRVHCLPVRMKIDGDRCTVAASADLNTCVLHMLRANAIARLPEEPSMVSAGDVVDVHLLRGEFSMLEEMEDLTSGSAQAYSAVSAEKGKHGGKVRRMKFHQRNGPSYRT